MPRQKSDLPFGSQFTPAQTPLPRLLEIISVSQPDRLLEAIIHEFFADSGTDDHSRAEVAKNTPLALIAYGVLDRDRRLTALGRELIAARTDERRLYDVLARHILLNLHGLELVQAVQDMRTAGSPITLETLRVELERRGVHMPRGGMHISAMKGWLEQAGVFEPGEGYVLNSDRLRQVIGAGLNEIEVLADLSREHRAFLKALARLGGQAPRSSSAVARYAEDLYGVRFPEKSLPRVLAPLADAGFVRLEKTTAGRGAKPYEVVPTERFRAEVVLPLLDVLEQTTGIELRALLNRPLSETLGEMQSNDRQVKGKALEALAVYLCWLLDLTFRGWRRRGPETAGAEVDVLAEAARLTFNRWQIQCKNTAAVSLDDIAKEVGVAVKTKPHVIMIVTSGRVGPDARGFATDIMRETHLNVALVEGPDLGRVAKDPMAIVDVLRREAENAMEIKRIEV